jgi:hypothetical protein
MVIPDGTAEFFAVPSIVDVCPFAAATPIPEATAAVANDAVLKKSLGEERMSLSSFDILMGI